MTDKSQAPVQLDHLPYIRELAALAEKYENMVELEPHILTWIAARMAHGRWSRDEAVRVVDEVFRVVQGFDG